MCMLLAACGATGRENADDRQVDPVSGAIVDASTEATPFVCSAVTPTSCPDPPLRYPDVAPIFHARCAAVCHSGIADGPWSLRDYEHVADWWDVIRDDILNCSMPPMDAGVPITTEERIAIVTWIRCGFPP
jgi:hypothetical protein